MEIKALTRQLHRGTAAQRLQMVEQFKRSGLTRIEFSRRHGIPLATLSWWLARAKRTANLPAPVVFNEVMFAPAAATPGNAWAVEVIAPSGLTVRCREPLCVRDLARLLRDTRC